MSSCRNQCRQQHKRSREAEHTNAFTELQEQESEDCNLSRSHLIPGQVSCWLWLPVPPLTAWLASLPPNLLNSFMQEEKMQVSRSNANNLAPDAVGLGGVVRRTRKNDQLLIICKSNLFTCRYLSFKTRHLCFCPKTCKNTKLR